MNKYRSRKVYTDRLLREYDTHGGLIVAVDWDSTLYDYHKENLVTSDVWNLIKKLKESYNAKIYIYTAGDESRVRSQLFDMIGSESLDFPINVSPVDTSGKKLYYNILLDDRAGLNETIAQLEGFMKIIDNRIITDSMGNTLEEGDKIFIKNNYSGWDMFSVKFVDGEWKYHYGDWYSLAKTLKYSDFYIIKNNDRKD